MEQNRVHLTRTTAVYVAVATCGSSDVMYAQLRRNWRNPQLPTRRACVCLAWVAKTMWFGATHTTTRAETLAGQPVCQDTLKEVSNKARDHALPAQQHSKQPHSTQPYSKQPHPKQPHSAQRISALAQLRYHIHIQERGWVLKPKPMQRCRRDAVCKQLEETRTLEQLCVQRPPKTHPLISGAINAHTLTELSFRSPLRLRAQVSRERPDRDITSHLSVYRKATAFA